MMKSTQCKILIVDDEIAVTNTLCEMVKKLNFTAVCVQDPKEALNIVEADLDSFDLMLTDINMPEITGIDLASRAKEKIPDFPVILLSGFVNVKYQKEMVTLTGVRWLVKPIDLKELSFAIAKALDKGK